MPVQDILGRSRFKSEILPGFTPKRACTRRAPRSILASLLLNKAVAHVHSATIFDVQEKIQLPGRVHKEWGMASTPNICCVPRWNNLDPHGPFHHWRGARQV